MLGKILVECLKGLPKLLISTNQKSFWKKYHAPLLDIWVEVQKSAVGQICTEPFSKNLVTNFGYQKSSLFACRCSQTHPKLENLIAIRSFIKAALGYQKSAPSYKVNSLNFDSEKLSVETLWDHLNLLSVLNNDHSLSGWWHSSLLHQIVPSIMQPTQRCFSTDTYCRAWESLWTLISWYCCLAFSLSNKIGRFCISSALWRRQS